MGIFGLSFATFIAVFFSSLISAIDLPIDSCSVDFPSTEVVSLTLAFSPTTSAQLGDGLLIPVPNTFSPAIHTCSLVSNAGVFSLVLENGNVIVLSALENLPIIPETVVICESDPLTTVTELISVDGVVCSSDIALIIQANPIINTTPRFTFSLRPPGALSSYSLPANTEVIVKYAGIPPIGGFLDENLYQPLCSCLYSDTNQYEAAAASVLDTLTITLPRNAASQLDCACTATVSGVWAAQALIVEVMVPGVGLVYKSSDAVYMPPSSGPAVALELEMTLDPEPYDIVSLGFPEMVFRIKDSDNNTVFSDGDVWIDLFLTIPQTLSCTPQLTSSHRANVRLNVENGLYTIPSGTVQVGSFGFGISSSHGQSPVLYAILRPGSQFSTNGEVIYVERLLSGIIGSSGRSLFLPTDNPVITATVQRATLYRNPGYVPSTSVLELESASFVSPSGLYTDTVYLPQGEGLPGAGTGKGIWAHEPAGLPRPRFLSANAKSVNQRRLYTVGGQVLQSSIGSDAHRADAVLMDVWVYDVVAGSHTLLYGDQHTLGITAIKGAVAEFDHSYHPAARHSAAAAVDVNEEYLYLHGGCKDVMCTALFSDLWVFDIKERMWAWISGNHMPISSVNSCPDSETLPLLFGHSLSTPGVPLTGADLAKANAVNIGLAPTDVLYIFAGATLNPVAAANDVLQIGPYFASNAMVRVNLDVNRAASPSVFRGILPPITTTGLLCSTTTRPSLGQHLPLEGLTAAVATGLTWMPPATVHASMAYDPYRNVLWVYGGMHITPAYDPSDTYTHDTVAHGNTGAVGKTILGNPETGHFPGGDSGALSWLWKYTLTTHKWVLMSTNERQSPAIGRGAPRYALNDIDSVTILPPFSAYNHPGGRVLTAITADAEHVYIAGGMGHAFGVILPLPSGVHSVDIGVSEHTGGSTTSTPLSLEVPPEMAGVGDLELHCHIVYTPDMLRVAGVQPGTSLHGLEVLVKLKDGHAEFVTTESVQLGVMVRSSNAISGNGGIPSTSQESLLIAQDVIFTTAIDVRQLKAGAWLSVGTNSAQNGKIWVSGNIVVTIIQKFPAGAISLAPGAITGSEVRSGGQTHSFYLSRSNPSQTVTYISNFTPTLMLRSTLLSVYHPLQMVLPHTYAGFDAHLDDVWRIDVTADAFEQDIPPSAHTQPVSPRWQLLQGSLVPTPVSYPPLYPPADSITWPLLAELALGARAGAAVLSPQPDIHRVTDTESLQNIFLIGGFQLYPEKRQFLSQSVLNPEPPQLPPRNFAAGEVPASEVMIYSDVWSLKLSSPCLDTQFAYTCGCATSPARSPRALSSSLISLPRGMSCASTCDDNNCGGVCMKAAGHYQCLCTENLGFSTPFASDSGFETDFGLFCEPDLPLPELSTDDRFVWTTVFPEPVNAGTPPSPGARFGAAATTDNRGCVWLYGGLEGTGSYHRDLWRHCHGSEAWEKVWVASNNAVYENHDPSVVEAVSDMHMYETLPTALHEEGEPGLAVKGVLFFGKSSRKHPVSDRSLLNDDKLFLFTLSPFQYAAIWEYHVSTNKWYLHYRYSTLEPSPTSFTNAKNILANPGTGAPYAYSPDNAPAIREAPAATAHDGKLYVFSGGALFSGNAKIPTHHLDLWVYDSEIHQWSMLWGQQEVDATTYTDMVTGITTTSPSPVVRTGERGQFSGNNSPGCRVGAAAAISSFGLFLYVHGGIRPSPHAFPFLPTINPSLLRQSNLGQWDVEVLEDLWVFNLNTRQWAWIAGALEPATAKGRAGAYMSTTPHDLNAPPARFLHAMALSENGFLYLDRGLTVTFPAQESEFSQGARFTPLNDLFLLYVPPLTSTTLVATTLKPKMSGLVPHTIGRAALWMSIMGGKESYLSPPSYAEAIVSAYGADHVDTNASNYTHHGEAAHASHNSGDASLDVGDYGGDGSVNSLGNNANGAIAFGRGVPGVGFTMQPAFGHTSVLTPGATLVERALEYSALAPGLIADLRTRLRAKVLGQFYVSVSGVTMGTSTPYSHPLALSPASFMPGRAFTYVWGKPCDRILCLNGGTCASTSSKLLVDEPNVKCECPPHHYGAYCQFSYCDLYPCRNGGTCTITAASANTDAPCLCPQGFTGAFCDTPTFVLSTLAATTANASAGPGAHFMAAMVSVDTLPRDVEVLQVPAGTRIAVISGGFAHSNLNVGAGASSEGNGDPVAVQMSILGGSWLYSESTGLMTDLTHLLHTYYFPDIGYVPIPANAPPSDNGKARWGGCVTCSHFGARAGHSISLVRHTAAPAGLVPPSGAGDDVLVMFGGYMALPADPSPYVSNATKLTTETDTGKFTSARARTTNTNVITGTGTSAGVGAGVGTGTDGPSMVLSNQLWEVSLKDGTIQYQSGYVPTTTADSVPTGSALPIDYDETQTFPRHEIGENLFKGFFPSGRAHHVSHTLTVEGKRWLYVYGGFGADRMGQIGFLGDLWRLDLEKYISVMDGGVPVVEPNPNYLRWQYIGCSVSHKDYIFLAGQEEEARHIDASTPLYIQAPTGSDYEGCPSARAHAASSVDSRGRLWVVGGTGARGPLDDVWVYDATISTLGAWYRVQGTQHSGHDPTTLDVAIPQDQLLWYIASIASESGKPPDTDVPFNTLSYTATATYPELGSGCVLGQACPLHSTQTHAQYTYSTDIHTYAPDNTRIGAVVAAAAAATADGRTMMVYGGLTRTRAYTPLYDDPQGRYLSEVPSVKMPFRLDTSEGKFYAIYTPEDMAKVGLQAGSVVTQLALALATTYTGTYEIALSVSVAPMLTTTASVLDSLVFSSPVTVAPTSGHVQGGYITFSGLDIAIPTVTSSDVLVIVWYVRQVEPGYHSVMLACTPTSTTTSEKATLLSSAPLETLLSRGRLVISHKDAATDTFTDHTFVSCALSLRLSTRSIATMGPSNLLWAIDMSQPTSNLVATTATLVSGALPISKRAKYQFLEFPGLYPNPEDDVLAIGYAYTHGLHAGVAEMCYDWLQYGEMMTKSSLSGSGVDSDGAVFGSSTLLVYQSGYQSVDAFSPPPQPPSALAAAPPVVPVPVPGVPPSLAFTSLFTTSADAVYALGGVSMLQKIDSKENFNPENTFPDSELDPAGNRLLTSSLYAGAGTLRVNPYVYSIGTPIPTSIFYTHCPVLTTIAFSSDFMAIHLDFDMATRTPSSTASYTSTTCNTILDSSSIDLISPSSRCAWTARHRFTIYLDPNHRVKVGVQLGIRGDVVYAIDPLYPRPAYAKVLPVAQSTPSRARAVITPIGSSTPCHDLLLSAIGSMGGYGQRMLYQWELLPHTEVSNRAAITAFNRKLNNVPYDNECAEMYPGMIRATCDAEIRLTPEEANAVLLPGRTSVFQLTVTNRYGDVDITTVAVFRNVTVEPMVTVDKYSYRKDVDAPLLITATATASRCELPAGITRRTLEVTWAALEGSLPINLSNTSHVVLQEYSLAVLPHGLPVGTYTLAATATETHYNTLGEVQQRLTHTSPPIIVHVDVPSPLARLTGAVNRTVSMLYIRNRVLLRDVAVPNVIYKDAGDDIGGGATSGGDVLAPEVVLTLSAATSTDPSITTTTSTDASPSLSFTWHCTLADTFTPCFSGLTTPDGTLEALPTDTHTLYIAVSTLETLAMAIAASENTDNYLIFTVVTTRMADGVTARASSWLRVDLHTDLSLSLSLSSPQSATPAPPLFPAPPLVPSPSTDTSTMLVHSLPHDMVISAALFSSFSSSSFSPSPASAPAATTTGPARTDPAAVGNTPTPIIRWYSDPPLNLTSIAQTLSRPMHPADLVIPASHLLPHTHYTLHAHLYDRTTAPPLDTYLDTNGVPLPSPAILATASISVYIADTPTTGACSLTILGPYTPSTSLDVDRHNTTVCDSGLCRFRAVCREWGDGNVFEWMLQTGNCGDVQEAVVSSTTTTTGEVAVKAAATDSSTCDVTSHTARTSATSAKATSSHCMLLPLGPASSSPVLTFTANIDLPSALRVRVSHRRAVRYVIVPLPLSAGAAGDVDGVLAALVRTLDEVEYGHAASAGAGVTDSDGAAYEYSGGSVDNASTDNDSDEAAYGYGVASVAGDSGTSGAGSGGASVPEKVTAEQLHVIMSGSSLINALLTTQLPLTTLHAPMTHVTTPRTQAPLLIKLRGAVVGDDERVDDVGGSTGGAGGSATAKAGTSSHVLPLASYTADDMLLLQQRVLRVLTSNATDLAIYGLMSPTYSTILSFGDGVSTAPFVQSSISPSSAFGFPSSPTPASSPPYSATSPFLTSSIASFASPQTLPTPATLAVTPAAAASVSEAALLALLCPCTHLSTAYTRIHCANTLTGTFTSLATRNIKEGVPADISERILLRLASIYDSFNATTLALSTDQLLKPYLLSDYGIDSLSLARAPHRMATLPSNNTLTAADIDMQRTHWEAIQISQQLLAAAKVAAFADVTLRQPASIPHVVASAGISILADAQFVTSAPTSMNLDSDFLVTLPTDIASVLATSTVESLAPAPANTTRGDGGVWTARTDSPESTHMSDRNLVAGRREYARRVADAREAVVEAEVKNQTQDASTPSPQPTHSTEGALSQSPPPSLPLATLEYKHRLCGMHVNATQTLRNVLSAYCEGITGSGVGSDNSGGGVGTNTCAGCDKPSLSRYTHSLTHPYMRTSALTATIEGTVPIMLKGANLTKTLTTLISTSPTLMQFATADSHEDTHVASSAVVDMTMYDRTAVERVAVDVDVTGLRQVLPLRWMLEPKAGEYYIDSHSNTDGHMTTNSGVRSRVRGNNAARMHHNSDHHSTTNASGTTKATVPVDAAGMGKSTTTLANPPTPSPSHFYFTFALPKVAAAQWSKLKRKPVPRCQFFLPTTLKDGVVDAGEEGAGTGVGNTTATGSAPSTGAWSTEGCELVSVTATHATCKCSHLTYFRISFGLDDLFPSINLLSWDDFANLTWANLMQHPAPLITCLVWLGALCLLVAVAWVLDIHYDKRGLVELAEQWNKVMIASTDLSHVPSRAIELDYKRYGLPQSAKEFDMCEYMLMSQYDQLGQWYVDVDRTCVETLGVGIESKHGEELVERRMREGGAVADGVHLATGAAIDADADAVDAAVDGGGAAEADVSLVEGAAYRAGVDQGADATLTPEASATEAEKCGRGVERYKEEGEEAAEEDEKAKQDNPEEVMLDMVLATPEAECENETSMKVWQGSETNSDNQGAKEVEEDDSIEVSGCSHSRGVMSTPTPVLVPVRAWDEADNAGDEPCSTGTASSAGGSVGPLPSPPAPPLHAHTAATAPHSHSHPLHTRIKTSQNKAYTGAATRSTLPLLTLPPPRPPADQSNWREVGSTFSDKMKSDHPLLTLFLRSPTDDVTFTGHAVMLMLLVLSGLAISAFFTENDEHEIIKDFIVGLITACLLMPVMVVLQHAIVENNHQRLAGFVAWYAELCCFLRYEQVKLLQLGLQPAMPSGGDGLDAGREVGEEELISMIKMTIRKQRIEELERERESTERCPPHTPEQTGRAADTGTPHDIGAVVVADHAGDTVEMVRVYVSQRSSGNLNAGVVEDADDHVCVDESDTDSEVSTFTPALTRCECCNSTISSSFNALPPMYRLQLLPHSAYEHVATVAQLGTAALPRVPCRGEVEVREEVLLEHLARLGGWEALLMQRRVDRESVSAAVSMVQWQEWLRWAEDTAVALGEAAGGDPAEAEAEAECDDNTSKTYTVALIANTSVDNANDTKPCTPAATATSSGTPSHLWCHSQNPTPRPTPSWLYNPTHAADCAQQLHTRIDWVRSLGLSSSVDGEQEAGVNAAGWAETGVMNCDTDANAIAVTQAAVKSRRERTVARKAYVSPAVTSSIGSPPFSSASTPSPSLLSSMLASLSKAPFLGYGLTPRSGGVPSEYESVTVDTTFTTQHLPTLQELMAAHHDSAAAYGVGNYGRGYGGVQHSVDSAVSIHAGNHSADKGCYDDACGLPHDGNGNVDKCCDYDGDMHCDAYVTLPPIAARVTATYNSTTDKHVIPTHPIAHCNTYNSTAPAHAYPCTSILRDPLPRHTRPLAGPTHRHMHLPSAAAVPLSPLPPPNPLVGPGPSLVQTSAAARAQLATALRQHTRIHIPHLLRFYDANMPLLPRSAKGKLSLAFLVFWTLLCGFLVVVYGLQFDMAAAEALEDSAANANPSTNGAGMDGDGGDAESAAEWILNGLFGVALELVLYAPLLLLMDACVEARVQKKRERERAIREYEAAAQLFRGVSLYGAGEAEGFEAEGDASGSASESTTATSREAVAAISSAAYTGTQGFMASWPTSTTGPPVHVPGYHPTALSTVLPPSICASSNTAVPAAQPPHLSPGSRSHSTRSLYDVQASIVAACVNEDSSRTRSGYNSARISPSSSMSSLSSASAAVAPASASPPLPSARPASVSLRVTTGAATITDAVSVASGPTHGSCCPPTPTNNIAANTDANTADLIAGNTHTDTAAGLRSHAPSLQRDRTLTVRPTFVPADARLLSLLQRQQLDFAPHRFFTSAAVEYPLESGFPVLGHMHVDVFWRLCAARTWACGGWGSAHHYGRHESKGTGIGVGASAGVGSAHARMYNRVGDKGGRAVGGGAGNGAGNEDENAAETEDGGHVVLPAADGNADKEDVRAIGDGDLYAADSNKADIRVASGDVDGVFGDDGGDNYECYRYRVCDSGDASNSDCGGDNDKDGEDAPSRSMVNGIISM